MIFESPPHAAFVVLEGQISHGPLMRVLLDTGNATPFHVMISPTAAARAGIVADTDDGRLTGLAGAISQASPVILPDFSLGPVQLLNPRAAVFPALSAVGEKVGAPIDALVGAEFLMGRVVSIHYEAKRVDFAAPIPAAHPKSFRFAGRRPLILVTARLNGRGSFVFALDTAASHTLLSPTAAERAGLKSSGEVTATGAGGDIAVGVTNGRVTLGPHDRTGPLFITAAVDHIGEVAGAALDGVIGADIFGFGILTLDYSGRRLWMEVGKPRS